MALTFDSRFGIIFIRTEEKSIKEVRIIKEHLSLQATEFDHKVKQELEDYFRGELTQFSTRVAPDGSEFQKQVWFSIKKIEYGQTMTYGELARSVNRPKAFQAVGTACGKNPILFYIPCHRVTAQNHIGGFAHGNKIKADILSLEGLSY